MVVILDKMISPRLLSDSLAAKVASEVIYSKLQIATIDYLTNEIMESASKELLDIRSSIPCCFGLFYVYHEGSGYKIGI